VFAVEADGVVLGAGLYDDHISAVVGRGEEDDGNGSNSLHYCMYSTHTVVGGELSKVVSNRL
jgi:hypothetical protein